ncbi:MAG: HD-GYP domain-containing protein [Armatimonadota bacterium]|nr:HD-GYP domain-containing protein [Armatimonadota bacterium]
MSRHVARPQRPGLDIWDQIRLAFLISPVAILVVMFFNPAIDPMIKVPGFHFAIVTLAAGTAALVALAVLAVASQLGDPRAFYLGLAFCAIAGFFFIHGLLTPGVIMAGLSNGIGWAPLLSLLLGSICLALSTARTRPHGEPWVFRHRRALAVALFAAWAAFLTVSLTVPRFLEWHPTSLALQSAVGGTGPAAPPPAAPAHAHPVDPLYDARPQAARAPHPPWIAGAMMLTTAGLLVFAALRYGRIFRLSRLPLHATIVAGIVLLLESLLPLFFGTVWRLSWWMYHVLILMGVAAILYGMVLDYRRGANLLETISTLLLKGSVDTLERSHSEVLTALVAAVEARDVYTKGHSEAVARLAVQIGEHLGLSPERLRVLHHAALLHDIGKIGVPDSILNKPGRLTHDEMAVVQEHPMRAEEMIARIPSLRPLIPAIRWHHERLDGTGYPEGLRGDAIPLEARILAVADVFDAMSSGRSYRAAWPLTAVLAHLREEAGRRYDRQCVEAVAQIAGYEIPTPAGEIRGVAAVPSP